MNANPRKLNENSRKYNFTSIHVSFTSIRVQINKLFNVVTVVVNISKTSCHQVVVTFWRCKGTTFFWTHQIFKLFLTSINHSVSFTKFFYQTQRYKGTEFTTLCFFMKLKKRLCISVSLCSNSTIRRTITWLSAQDCLYSCEFRHQRVHNSASRHWWNGRRTACR